MKQILDIVPFAKWRPDAAILLDQYGSIASGVYPGPTGYRPFPDMGATIYLSALNARCQGAAAFVSPVDQSPAIVAGSATKLYKNNGTTAADASGATYTIDASETWEFADFGGKVLATNANDPIQSADMGGIGLFADAATSTLKPKARHMAVIGRQVHIGDTVELGVNYPNRARWAGVDSAAVDWDASQTTMADKQDIEGVGTIRRIIGGFTYGLYFCDECIVRANFVGTPDIYTMDKLEPGRGTIASGSVAAWGSKVIFLDDAGFFMTDGLNSVPIGVEKVDSWFFANSNASYYYRMSATIDRKRQMYILSYVSAAGTSPDMLLFFHIPTGEWAYAAMNLEYLFTSRTPALSMEDLDTNPLGGSNLDLITISLDSEVWAASSKFLAGFNASHEMRRFDGSNLAAQIDTSVYEPFPGKRGRLDSVRVIVDAGTPSVAIAPRENLTDTETFGTPVAQDAIGGQSFFDTGNSGRYFKLRATMPAAGTWTHLEGIQPTGSKLGAY